MQINLFCVLLFESLTLFSYRRYFGVVIPHQKAALYTARRSELIDVMDQTLFFLNRSAMVRIYSPYSDVPRYVSISSLYLAYLINILILNWS